MKKSMKSAGRQHLILMLILLLLIGCTPKQDAVTSYEHPFDETSSVVIDGDPLIDFKNPETKVLFVKKSKLIILEYTVENNGSEEVEVGHFSHLEKLVEGIWKKQTSVEVEFPAELKLLQPGESYVDNFPISVALPELLMEGSPDLEGSYRLVKTIEPFGVYELRFEIDAKFMNNIK